MTNTASPPRVPTVDDLVRVFDDIDRVKAAGAAPGSSYCRRCGELFYYRMNHPPAPWFCEDCKKY